MALAAVWQDEGVSGEAVFHRVADRGDVAFDLTAVLDRQVLMNDRLLSLE